MDRARAAAGLSIAEVIAGARVHPSTWYLAKKGAVPTRQITLKRLLAFITTTAQLPKPAPLIRAFVAAAEIVIAAEIGRDRKLIALLAHKRPRATQPKTVEPVRLRCLAVYLTAVELEVPNATMARALLCSRQNIKQVRDEIYDLVDANAAVEDLFARCAARVKGTAA